MGDHELTVRKDGDSIVIERPDDSNLKVEPDGDKHTVSEPKTEKIPVFRFEGENN